MKSANLALKQKVGPARMDGAGAWTHSQVDFKQAKGGGHSSKAGMWWEKVRGGGREGEGKVPPRWANL